MSKTLKILFPIILCACAQTPDATNKAVESTQEAVKALETSLPKGCKTDAIMGQIKALYSRIDSLEQTCITEAEKFVAEEKISSYRWKIATTILGAALVIVLIWFGRVQSRAIV